MKFQTPEGDLKYYLPNGGILEPRVIPMVIEYLESHDEWSLMNEGSYVESLLQNYPDHFQNNRLRGLVNTRLALGVIEMAFRERENESK